MQNMQTNEIPLHDIKPLLAIPDYSFYYFLGVVSLLCILALGATYLLYRYLKNRKTFNIRKEHHKNLNSIDMNETKKAAYELTQYGATFKDDSERNLKTFHDMTDRLEKYKYKKSVEAFDSEALRVIELYRGMIDV